MNFQYSISQLDFFEITSKKKILGLLEKHDQDTFQYSVHTALLNMAISRELELDEETVFLFYQCGMFHDTGKLGMSPEFLNYPGSYTIEMYKEMKKHTSGGGIILEKINAEKELIETAKFHHCNFDGSGYPGGFYYHDIPLHARITRISDSVDAYMSKRCYKEGGPINAVVEDLNYYIGKSYDPVALAAFGNTHAKIMQVCHKEGLDQPSQQVYMHFLEKIYGSECRGRFSKEILCI